jgi:hypothetical protein
MPFGIALKTYRKAWWIIAYMRTENIPDDWVGKRALVQYKVRTMGPDKPYEVESFDCVIEEKNDLGLVIQPLNEIPGSARGAMFITYDALLTVELAMEH